MIRRRNCGKAITFNKKFINTHTKIIRQTNPNYCIIDNRGQGDCFFLALQQAASLYTNTPREKRPFEVENLRSQVASNFGEARYDELKGIVNTMNQDDIPAGSLLEVIDSYSYTQTKQFMKSQDYWADEYAIEMLSKRMYSLDGQEKRLRFIIYDTDKFWIPRFFMITDENNTIDNEEFSRLPSPQRERLVRSDEWKEKQKRDFHYVILIAETDNHYGLIAEQNEENPYQMKTVFNFEDLPESLKDLVNRGLNMNLGIVQPSQRRRNNVSNTRNGGNSKKENKPRAYNKPRANSKKENKPRASSKKENKPRAKKTPYEKLSETEKRLVDAFIESKKKELNESELNVIYYDISIIQDILNYEKKK